MADFLIFGRPRSRTAWMANFLSHGSYSTCFHEGLADSAGSFMHLKRRMRDCTITGFVGNADTGMIHNVEEALSTFPDARILMMVDNEFSWRTHCTKFEIPAPVIEHIDDDYARAKETLRERALFISATRVTQSHVVANRAWRHVLQHSMKFPLTRYNILKDLNVQVVPEALKARIGIT